MFHGSEKSFDAGALEAGYEILLKLINANDHQPRILVPKFSDLTKPAAAAGQHCIDHYLNVNQQQVH